MRPFVINELVSNIMYEFACTYSKASNQFARSYSLITAEETFDPRLSIERASKTLIRLCGCAV